MKRITTLLVYIFTSGLVSSYAQFNFENQIEKKEITKKSLIQHMELHYMNR